MLADRFRAGFVNSTASVADYVGLNLSIPSGFAVTAAAETHIADDGFTGNIENVVVTVTKDGQSILVIDSLRKEH